MVREDINRPGRSRMINSQRVENDSRRGKGKGISNVVKWIILAVAEVLTLGVIFSYAYVSKQLNKVQRIEVNKEEVKNNDISVETIKKMEGYRTIAIFGVDSRDSGVGKGYNSDVIIIANIDLATSEVRLASIFRDSYLNTGYDKFNKINQAYAIGGPEQALKAINKNLDLNITEYVTFSWKAVATGINILGGVDVEITKPEFRYINSYITETVKSTNIGSVQLKEPGMHHLDGIQAVAYARLRYMDSDYERTARQRRVIQLALDKAKKSDLKTLNDLVGNMMSMVATNLTWQDGLDVISDIGSYKIVDTMGFPEDRKEMNMGAKGAIVVPNTLEKNVSKLHTFLFGDEVYTVSKTVKELSNEIEYQTSNYSGGKSSGKGEKSKKTEAETQSSKEAEESSNSSNSSKSSSKASREYETNSNGETIWIDEEPDTDVTSKNSSESGQGTKSSSSESGSKQSSSSSGEESSSSKPGSSTASSTQSSNASSTASSTQSSSAASTAASSTQSTTAAPSTTAVEGPGGNLPTVENKPQ